MGSLEEKIIRLCFLRLCEHESFYSLSPSGFLEGILLVSVSSVTFFSPGASRNSSKLLGTLSSAVGRPVRWDSGLKGIMVGAMRNPETLRMCE